ncbi:MAG: hypothetical protein AAGG68_07465 [Bacteroidota bacterium]
MNDYEKYFEEVQDRSILISELIEQLIQLEDIISLHKRHDSTGLAIKQYVDRKEEFNLKLNQFLTPFKMKLIYQEAA